MKLPWGEWFVLRKAEDSEMKEVCITEKRKPKDRDESKGDILIEGAIMGLARNAALEKFPGIHRDDPS